MATKLKPKSKFFTDAPLLLKKGLNPADLQDIAYGYEGITADDIQSVIKSLQVNNAIKSQLELDRKEAQKIYNVIDNLFIEKYPYLVAFEQDENISYYNYEHGVYVKLTKNTLTDKIHDFFIDNNLLEYRSVSKVKDTFARITSLLQYRNNKRFNYSKFESKEYYINVKNGLLDPITKELKPHTPDYFSIAQLPFDYDPEATCPKFLEAIKTSSIDAEDTDVMLQEMYGYMIGYRGNPLHKIFYMYGRVGRNSKTMQALIIMGLAGIQNVSTLSIENLTSQSDSIITPLIGKQINFSDEANASRFLDSGRLTSISAQGTVTISPKYEAPFTYQVKSKFLVACNYLPNYQSPQGMKQRTIIIPFNYSIPPEERIIDYDKILLEEEGSGILNWALDGTAKLKAQNNIFTISELSKQDSEDNIKGNDSVLAYVDEMVEINILKYAEKIPTRHIYDEYIKYCNMSGYQKKGFHTFSQSLKTYADENKTIEYNSTQPRGYKGIYLKPELTSAYEQSLIELNK